MPSEIDLQYGPNKIEGYADYKAGLRPSLPDGDRWNDSNFAMKYLMDQKKDTVWLEEVGWLEAVEEGFYAKGIYERFLEQIYEEAALVASEKGSGSWLFGTSFRNTYQFGDVCFSFGSVTMSGEFVGIVKVGEDGSYEVEPGAAQIYFFDIFTDPLDIGVDFGNPYWIKGSFFIGIPSLSGSDK